MVDKIEIKNIKIKEKRKIFFMSKKI